jgi:hypothetical protein
LCLFFFFFCPAFSEICIDFLPFFTHSFMCY